MADGKIYIYITTDKPKSTGETGESTEKKDNKNKGDMFFAHELAHFAKAQASQMVNYALNNIGNFTGDYQTQKEIQHAVQMAGSIKNIALSAYAGFRIAGVAGGVVAGGLAIASQTINFVLAEAQAQLQINKQNYEISKLREISGLNGLTNGSRI